MKYLFLVIYFLYSFSLFGQEAELKWTKSDTNFVRINSKERDSIYLGLPLIKNSQWPIHLRISFLGQIIDFYSSNNKTFYGTLTNQITEYRYQKNDTGGISGGPYRILYQTQTLDSELCSEVASEVLKSGQLNIPSDLGVIPWRDCWDLECRIKYFSKYIEQEYNCPYSLYDSIQYKELLLSNLELLQEKLQLSRKFFDFFILLPIGEFYSVAGGIGYSFATEEKHRAWVQHRASKFYLRSIKDTLDNYLIAELNKHKPTLEKVDCFEDYIIEFNTDGQLQEVTLKEWAKPKLSYGLGIYLDDLRTTRKCRKTIKKVFENISLTTFNLEYGFSRVLSFYEGNIRLEDETSYLLSF